VSLREREYVCACVCSSTPTQCVLSVVLMSIIGHFCISLGLFCTYTGLFCINIGHFRMYTCPVGCAGVDVCGVCVRVYVRLRQGGCLCVCV